jgi:hypothetical protein
MLVFRSYKFWTAIWLHVWLPWITPGKWLDITLKEATFVFGSFLNKYALMTIIYWPSTESLTFITNVTGYMEIWHQGKFRWELSRVVKPWRLWHTGHTVRWDKQERHMEFMCGNHIEDWGTCPMVDFSMRDVEPLGFITGPRYLLRNLLELTLL